MTYRDDTPSLRAECERLRAELRPPTRWALIRDGGKPVPWLILATVLRVACIVIDGRTPRHVLWAGVVAAAWLVWALAFVRRVPAEGSAR